MKHIRFELIKSDLTPIRVLIVKNKAEELKNGGSDLAYAAVIVLHAALTQLKDRYCQGKINCQGLRTSAKQAMDSARPELEKQQG